MTSARAARQDHASVHSFVPSSCLIECAARCLPERFVDWLRSGVPKRQSIVDLLAGKIERDWFWRMRTTDWPEVVQAPGTTHHGAARGLRSVSEPAQSRSMFSLKDFAISVLRHRNFVRCRRRFLRRAFRPPGVQVRRSCCRNVNIENCHVIAVHRGGRDRKAIHHRLDEVAQFAKSPLRYPTRSGVPAQCPRSVLLDSFRKKTLEVGQPFAR